MEIVVWLALVVLSVVFILSSCLLFVLCRRRHAIIAQRNQLLLHPNLRFSRLRNEHVDSFLQLSPLLDGQLEESEWMEGAQEACDHIVAVLKLAALIVKKLAEIDLTKCPPRIYQLICEAMPRVRPHYEDLVTFTPQCATDMKVVEARATTLTTVCWSLVLPFTLIAPAQKEELQSMVSSMYAHIDSLRESLLILDMQMMAEEGENDDDDENHQTIITHTDLATQNNTTNSSPNHPVDPAN